MGTVKPSPPPHRAQHDFEQWGNGRLTSAASSAVSCWRFELDGLNGLFRTQPEPSSTGAVVRLSVTALRRTFSVSSLRPASRWRTVSAFSTSERRCGGCSLPSGIPAVMSIFPTTAFTGSPASPIPAPA